MMSSYWAVGGSMLTNIVDMFKFKSENHVPTRLISLVCVALPPFALAYSGLVSFVDAIYLAGTFGGVIMSIPVSYTHLRAFLPGWSGMGWLYSC